MKNIIITGGTGMVGKSVLLECIDDPRIDTILLISRKSNNIPHDKVQELIITSYEELPGQLNNFKTYDACFHCMGVSSVGMNEQDFNYTTFELTKILTDSLFETNPNMIVNYVSGTGTDSSEKGRVMWARIKGKTENYILNKGFKDAYMIRLGALLPEKGIKSNTGWYNAAYTLTKPLYPLLKNFQSILTTTEFGKAMINTIFNPQVKKHLENKDLKKMI